MFIVIHRDKNILKEKGMGDAFKPHFIDFICALAHALYAISV